MVRPTELIDKARWYVPRGSRRFRIFEPVAQALTTHRGAFRPTLTYVRHHGLTVEAGPFTGLRFPPSSVLHVTGLASRLGGTYEIEIHAAIEELIGAHPPLIVNVGAGEGYYAVGMALRCPDARVLAYEADPYNARKCADLVRHNRVEDKVEQRGRCTVEDLAALDPPSGVAVICDCEGDEARLIDLERVGWLREARLLVEAHESFYPGLETELRDRLSATHEVESIWPAKRYLEDHELFWRTPGLSTIQQESLLSELRCFRTPWIRAAPVAE